MPIIKSYSEFRAALLEGAKTYNKNREENQNSEYRHYRGEKGRIRGIKAAHYAEKISEENEYGLLVLAYALFQTSSKELTMEIAQRLIQGDYSRSTMIASRHTRNTLTTTVFTPDAISETVIKKSEKAYTTPNIGTSYELNKRVMVQVILGQAREEIKNKEEFDANVEQMKQALCGSTGCDIDSFKNKDNRSETEMGLLKAQ